MKERSARNAQRRSSGRGAFLSGGCASWKNQPDQRLLQVSPPGQQKMDIFFRFTPRSLHIFYNCWLFA